MQLTGVSLPYGETMGHAKDWDTGGQSAGYNVDQTPEPGDIAQSNGGNYGHVGVVESVTYDGANNATSIVVSEYNKFADGNYSRTTYSSKEGPLFSRGNGYTWDNFIDVNGTGNGISGNPANTSSPTPPGTTSYASIGEGGEVTNGSWVYTKVGGKL